MPPAEGERCEVQIRHRGKPLGARVFPSLDSAKVRVELDEPADGVAPGQSAVFYLGDAVLGGAHHIVPVDLHIRGCPPPPIEIRRELVFSATLRVIANAFLTG